MKIAEMLKILNYSISNDQTRSFDDLMAKIAVNVESPNNDSADGTVYYQFSDGSELMVSNPNSVVYDRSLLIVD